jgi:hypothetical protein
MASLLLSLGSKRLYVARMFQKTEEMGSFAVLPGVEVF